jgi:hypothetical protein
MYKPISLRAHLSEALADLKQNPDKLLVFADEGNVVASASSSLSFEYRYTLNIIITDYAGEEDAIMVPLIAWIKVHQIELLENQDLRKTGIGFEVDFNNHETVDLSIKIALTERVIVKRGEHGRLDIKHLAEPQMAPVPASERSQLYDGDNMLAEWTTPQAVG